jgi:hypothetical protein
MSNKEYITRLDTLIDIRNKYRDNLTKAEIDKELYKMWIDESVGKKEKDEWKAKSKDNEKSILAMKKIISKVDMLIMEEEKGELKN